jgi:hypothetical protein
MECMIMGVKIIASKFSELKLTYLKTKKLKTMLIELIISL